MEKVENCYSYHTCYGRKDKYKDVTLYELAVDCRAFKVGYKFNFNHKFHSSDKT